MARLWSTEGFLRANASVTSKEPLTMNHLLMGKTALISKRPKRTSPVIQSATRANFEPSKKVLRNRSNTVANLLPNKTASINNLNSGSNACKGRDKNDESAKAAETLSWTQIKLEKKRQRFTRKMSEPVLGSFQESSVDESSVAVDDNSVQLNNDRNASMERLNHSSASSSSTELCDDHINDNLSDFASSPEVHRKKKPIETSVTSDHLSTKVNNNNNYFELKISEKPDSESLKIEVCSGLNDRNESNCKTTDQCLSADQCLIANNNSECDKSSLEFEHSSEPMTDNRDNRVKPEQQIDDNSNRESDAYSTIKREISELSLEQCIQKLNERLVSLNENNLMDNH